MPCYNMRQLRKKSIIGIKYYKNGHVWVSDGYFQRERQVDVYRKGSDKVHHSYTEKENYLHLNWGWDGFPMDII